MKEFYKKYWLFNPKMVATFVALLFFSGMASAQLSGTYTVDSGSVSSLTTKNFQSFNDLADSLATYGVSAAVTVNVTNATYTGQVPGFRRLLADAGGDFARFDLILGMDQGHRSELARRRPPEARARVHLFLDYAGLGERGPDVPDPYYGRRDGFEHVFDIVQRTCPHILDFLKKNF